METPFLSSWDGSFDAWGDFITAGIMGSLLGCATPCRTFHGGA